MIFERYVLELGLQLHRGSFVAPDAIVAMNLYVIARHKSV